MRVAPRVHSQHTRLLVPSFIRQKPKMMCKATEKQKVRPKALHHPHGHPKEPQRLTHPFRVTACKVVVHRHHMHALTKGLNGPNSKCIFGQDFWDVSPSREGNTFLAWLHRLVSQSRAINTNIIAMKILRPSLAREGIQKGGEDGNQGLALTVFVCSLRQRVTRKTLFCWVVNTQVSNVKTRMLCI